MGKNGDWKSEGYRIEHDTTSDSDGILHRARAYDKEGKKVGEALFIPQQSRDLKSKILAPYRVDVHPEHRRKGIANAMYSGAETHWGKKIEHNGVQDSDGRALWNQPNRPFGKRT